MLFFLKAKEKEQTIEQLLLENYNTYYRLAYSYVHNDADASDLVQNGAYKAILHARDLKEIQFAKTWLYRLMLNEIFSFLRQKPTTSLEELPPEHGTEDTYENIDLKRALDSMPEKDKAVIELKYFEDMTLREIAEILEENISTVKSRLYRSLKKLRLELSDDTPMD